MAIGIAQDKHVRIIVNMSPTSGMFDNLLEQKVLKPESRFARLTLGKLTTCITPFRFPRRRAELRIMAHLPTPK